MVCSIPMKSAMIDKKTWLIKMHKDKKKSIDWSKKFMQNHV